MEEPARHLLFHGVIILLLGLLAGIPYGRAILKKQQDSLIIAWRVAHSALTMNYGCYIDVCTCANTFTAKH